MALLSTTDWPSVRAAIDIALDTAVLPDSVIALDIYQGEAEEEVLERIGKTQSELTAEELPHAKRAARYLLAAMLATQVTALPYFGSDGSFDRVRVDWEARAAKLRERVADEIAEIVKPDDQAAEWRPTAFTTARGRRGA